jgi:uncharacterized membrane protein YphA (DoxX/SURF4 family)
MEQVPSNSDSIKRLDYYRWLTGATIIVTILATWNLWSCDRTCPTAPLIGIHSFISGTAGYVFKALLICLSLLFIMKVRYTGWLLLALFTAGFADDLNRILPNTYQFVIILLLFGIAQKDREDELLSGLRIVQSGVYLWTGILKLNSGFINHASGFVYNALHWQHPPAQLKYLILIVALWEVVIGLAFLSGKKVREAVISSVALHIAISIVLFISGWNRSFITYNLFLIAGNFILFSKAQVQVINEVEKPKAWVQKIAVALFILLPALNLIRLWPDMLSSSMYSYRSLNACIYIDENLKKQLSNEDLKAVFNSPQGQYLSITHWIQNETSTVPNPQHFVYNKMYRQFQSRYSCTDSVRLFLYYPGKP